MKKNNLARNTAFLGICSLLNKGLMFVMVPFFSRWLSTEEYGTFDVLSTYVSLLIPVITLACGNAIFRLAVEKNEKDSKAEYISNGLFLVLTNIVISLVLITLWKAYFGFEQYLPFIVILVAEVLDNYFQGYLRALKKLELYAISKSIGTVATAVMVTLFVRVLNWGLSGIIYGYATGFVLADITVIIATRYREYVSLKNFSKGKIRELVSYSAPLIPNDISWWVINASDRAIINIFLGATSNGIYSIACKIPNICAAVFGVFGISWQEAATDMVDEDGRNHYYQSVFSKVLRVIISLCIGILACNFLFFGWIFDIKYIDARFYAPILVTSIIFSTLSQFFGGIQISLKRPKENGVSTVIGAIVNVGVHLALVKAVGLYAAAVSTLVSNMVVMLIRQVKLKDTVRIYIDKQMFFLMILYLYFAAICYVDVNVLVSIINLVIAGVVFVFINKDICFKFLRKIAPKR